MYLNGVSGTDPAWAWWIDDRELAWHEAMVERDLGLAGKAIDDFERSVMATPTDEIRSQYLHRAYLLQSQVDNNTWAAAERTGTGRPGTPYIVRVGLQAQGTWRLLLLAPQKRPFRTSPLRYRRLPTCGLDGEGLIEAAPTDATNLRGERPRGGGAQRQPAMPRSTCA